MANIVDNQVVIEMDLSPSFVNAMDKMQKKYGDEFIKLNNFDNRDLNHSTFIDNFIDSSNANDISSDESANRGARDICVLTTEMTKPNHKLLNFNKIFYEIEKEYGIEKAEKFLEYEWNGATYLHDSNSATYKPYCFAYDLDQVVEKGLFFIDRFKTGPAKHLTTFNDHILETIGWLANRSSGAVGLPSYLIYSWYFWNKDVKNNFYLKNPEYYRRQCFQKVVHDLNQPYLRIVEPAFSNFTIMDRSYLTELFGGRMFPDGSFAIDHIEEILEHQKVFMEVVSEIRENNAMMTYPVLTYSLLFQNDKFVDEEFARWCSDHNVDWADSNFYCGADVTSLSNCCFGKDQVIKVKIGENIYTSPMKLLYQTYHHRDDIKILYEGHWLPAKLTALKENVPMYHIVTKGGRELTATYDHIHLTNLEETELPTHKLKVGDGLRYDNGLNNDLSYDTIVSIDRVEYDDEWVFCVEVQDETRPYFTLANGIITHNCRLISQTTKIKAFINSIGGTALSIGSIKVNTTNLRRIALETNCDEAKYMEKLTDTVDTVIITLDRIRHIIKRNVEKGLLPNYDFNLVDMEKQYNTIGINALYETIREFGYVTEDALGNISFTDDGVRFASEILEKINEIKESYGFDYSINIEAIPAERAARILATKDALLYPDTDIYPLYSNQWIALTENCTLQEKIRLSSILDIKCGGGAIAHINIGSPFNNKDEAWRVLNHIAANGVIYFAFNLIISSCANGHSFHGEICPKCGERANEKYTRIVGYYTPMSSWSSVRYAEGKARKFPLSTDLLNDI